VYFGLKAIILTPRKIKIYPATELHSNPFSNLLKQTLINIINMGVFFAMIFGFVSAANPVVFSASATL